MIEYTLNIGDVVATPRNARFVCYGLGSCIGLFVQDRIAKICGGAHILLPDDEAGPDKRKFYSVSSAMKELLSQFKSQGSNLQTLRAKITGGANVVRMNTDTGLKNAESVIGYLNLNRIFIAAVDVGGFDCRTAKFESNSGRLYVRKSGINENAVY